METHELESHVLTPGWRSALIREDLPLPLSISQNRRKLNISLTGLVSHHARLGIVKSECQGAKRWTRTRYTKHNYDSMDYLLNFCERGGYLG